MLRDADARGASKGSRYHLADVQVDSCSFFEPSGILLDPAPRRPGRMSGVAESRVGAVAKSPPHR